MRTDTDGTAVVSLAGGVALVETARVAGRDWALSVAFGRWRKPTAGHEPGKVITDLAVTLALDGDCLGDVALLREEPAILGESRLIRRCRARSTRSPRTQRGR